MPTVKFNICAARFKTSIRDFALLIINHNNHKRSNKYAQDYAAYGKLRSSKRLSVWYELIKY